MIELGKKSRLELIELGKSRKNCGFWCVSGERSRQRIKIRCFFLKTSARRHQKKGEKISVFIYRDSSDRLIATVREPKILLGQIGVLKVAQTSRIGAFLDWGLKITCFFHIKSRPRSRTREKRCLWPLYIDKSSRLCT